jgi:hypothetical protein
MVEALRIGMFEVRGVARKRKTAMTFSGSYMGT